MSDIVAIIPARFGSKRFPGKPLVNIFERPLIQWVFEGACACSSLKRVIVATDDERVKEAVDKFNGEAVLTSYKHTNGMERVAEVAEGLRSKIVVNIQGDEALIHHEIIEMVIEPLLHDGDEVMSSIKLEMISDKEYYSSNTVKVVCDLNDNALYFSRSMIPCLGSAECGMRSAELKSEISILRSRATAEDGRNPKPVPGQVQESEIEKGRRADGQAGFYKHIGIYAYKREFLIKLAKMPPTPLETIEGLEQLRALENGYNIKVKTSPHDSIGVNTPEDVKLVEEMIKKREGGKVGRGALTIED